MHPDCEITIDGKLASSVLMQRLINCEVIDKEGVSSDTVSIELRDSPPAVIPRKGAIIGVRMGYRGALTDMGTFEAEEIEVRVLPNTMRIVGKAAGMRGEGKTVRERNWDDTTIGQIVGQIAGEHGLRPSVDPTLAGVAFEWIGQVSESDFAFLERLAGRHDAIFSVKNRTMIFAAKGTGLSPTGAALTEIVVTPMILRPGSMSVRLADRAQFRVVVASWMDRVAGQRVDIKVNSDPEGEGEYRIGEQFATEAEASAAAEAKARELLRRQCDFACEVVGNPAARGGAPLRFVGCRPGIDDLAFIIETARHSYSKGGYTTSLSGQIKK